MTFLSGVVPHVMLGYTIVFAILAYFLLFSGFFITRERVPGPHEVLRTRGSDIRQHPVRAGPSGVEGEAAADDKQHPGDEDNEHNAPDDGEGHTEPTRVYGSE
ncbi:hypothetical protein MLD38_024182 [Melastoma candidum]|uniref:Uncharacterized protein n=1 Tax=Melastoma candidum TaxID=119954 RepID=A0ACB9NRJ9_9MYRT|nr:hypothetical protein MLD38_024182 [Melastoma candidum]